MRLPNLNINGFTIERESSKKNLGVWIDENHTWRDHIHTVESKILDSYIRESITSIIIASSKSTFTYIYAYLNYANIAWASAHKTKLKKVQSKEIHTLRVIFNQSKTSPSESLFLSLNVLNVYQINVFQSVRFMHKIKNKNLLHIFLKLFDVPYHAYPTKYSLINFSVPQTFLKNTRFAISEVHFFGTIAFQNKKKKLITFYCSKKGLKKK